MYVLTVVYGDNRRDAPFSSEENALHFGEKLAEEDEGYIVMYNELKEGVCAHCGKHIHEELGWVLYQWIHSDPRGYHCFGQDIFKAEPLVVI